MMAGAAIFFMKTPLAVSLYFKYWPMAVRIPNTTATAAEWKDAVYNSQTTVPNTDNWTGNINVAVNGWQTTYTAPVQPPQIGTYATAALAAGNLTVGGFLPTQGGVLRIDHVGN